MELRARQSSLGLMPNMIFTVDGFCAFSQELVRYYLSTAASSLGPCAACQFNTHCLHVLAVRYRSDSS